MDCLAQFVFLGSIVVGGPIRTSIHLLTASISLPWTSLVFLLIIASLGGAWWGYLRTNAPLVKPDTEADLMELAMLRAVVASLPDLIYVKDAQSRFLLANKATALAMGAASGQDLLGRSDFDFYPRGTAEGFFADEQRVITTGEPLVSQDEHIREPDGRTRWIMTTKVPLVDGVGRAIGIIGIGRNITRIKEMEGELRAAKSELEFKASHDSLTGLFNRGAMVEALAREFARARRGGMRTAVLLGDLDHFKNVNDEYGHPVGDEVLCEVARRLAGTVRNYDTVGRFGGEEFLVILSECGNADALSRADQLRHAVSADPIVTARGLVSITISFGVLVTESREPLSLDQALREVDLALYAAKAGGRNQCRMAGVAAQ